MRINFSFTCIDKDILEQKNRQLLRSQNIELKDLEFRLRSSYASKAALVQLNEREANRLEDKYQEKVANEKKNVWYNNNDFEKKLELDKKYALIKYKNELCDQLINNEMIRQQNDEEYQRERKIIEQVSEILHNDDIKMVQEKLEKIERTKQERDAFFKARDMWKSKEREAILNEFNKNAEIFRLKMIEENNRIQQRKSKVNQRDKGLDEIAKKILDDEVKRNEKQAIIDEIIAEEEKLEADNQMKNLRIKKEIVKRELLQDMERQKSLLKENREKEEKIDAAFAKYLKEQYETELKNDQEKKEERRKKAIEYGKELKKMCVDQRLAYAEEILQRQKSLHIDTEIENQRLKEVSSEKLKILQEHAENLKGFFNAKV
ncbi:meiosis-specific nuclear structural protein 1-like [Athalia rosae]|uniref:meiosis-specific nuclear structural protein 1-like n=1 Tax=Athalia rosae TaxID=37344 RepID=UPI00203371FA|nr:meiosis-specific nuclear structural protein 1-like [Athalia rosae]